MFDFRKIDKNRWYNVYFLKIKYFLPDVDSRDTFLITSGRYKHSSAIVRKYNFKYRR